MHFVIDVVHEMLPLRLFGHRPVVVLQIERAGDRVANEGDNGEANFFRAQGVAPLASRNYVC